MSDNKNMKQCKSCEKEVSKSAKLCPHCGKKLKMGWFLKVVIGLVAIAVISSITSPSLEEHLTKTSEAQVIKVSPRGELADLFSLMNDGTDIQRDNKEEELKGKYVIWTLPVFDVNKSVTKYRVQTGSSGGFIGTFIDVYTTSSEQATYVESLKTGDFITVKGVISGVSMRKINIDYAILVD